MSSKVRVYEVARDLGMDNKKLVALFQSVGVTEVRNHMSAVLPEQVERVKRHLEKQQSEKVVEERIRPTVVKRRSVAKRTAPAEKATAPATPAAPVAAAPVVRRRPAAAAAPVEPAPVAPAPRPAAPPTPVPSPEPLASEAEPKQTAAAAPAESAAAPSAPAEAKAPPKEVPAPTPVPEAKPEPAAAPTPPPPVEPPPAAEEAKPAPAAEPVAASAAPESPPALKVEPAPPPAEAAPRPSTPPRKTGVEVWEGRPGVPMPQTRGTPQPRRQTYDAKAPGNIAGRGGRPGMMGGRMGGRPARRGGIGSFSRGAKGGGGPVTQERSAHKKVVKIEETIGLQALGIKMGTKAQDLLRALITLGMQNVNINTTLDADTAKLVANEFGWEVEDVAVSETDALVAAQGLASESDDDEGKKKPRPPVVTVMGHVDHGKTSLLDALRKSNVVQGEAGGITQHIGAYSVDTPHGKITFLDTPGHAAFTAMRARGANVTDVVILLVAADDGVMPQTKEAIAHSREAGVPIIVAINKCDKPDAQPERVRRELSESGLVAEEWGGDVLMTEVSATKRTGISELLEQVMLAAEMLELRANPDKPAVGTVVEAQLDRGKGPVATVLVNDGTLHRGDVVLAGAAYGKVRAMHDSTGRAMQKAPPSTPVAIIGLNGVPSAGDPVHVVKDMKVAEEIAEKRKGGRASMAPSGQRPRSFEDIIRGMGQADELELKLIIKADVQGSVEALSSSILELSGEKVKVTVVQAGVGAITEGDVNLAVAAGATIIGFNVRPAGKASSLAQQEKVEIRQYNVIYNVVDDVTALMEGMLAPKLVEKRVGAAEVRAVFKITKAGMIAGCMVTDGVVRRNAQTKIMRGSELIHEGKLSSLKRFKDDAKEVKEGFECGISIDGFNDIKEGDVIEVFDLEEVKQKL